MRLQHGLLVLVLTGSTLAFAAAAEAASVAGERLPPTLSPPGGPQLTLAGCASREKLWQELYALGLYLPPEAALDRLREPGTAKAARVEVAYEGDLPQDPPDEWLNRLRQAAPQESVQTFLERYRTIRSGDTITLSYVPQDGTTVRVNDETIVRQPGHELADAMIGMWIGQDPVSEDMRSKLLSGSR